MHRKGISITAVFLILILLMGSFPLTTSASGAEKYLTVTTKEVLSQPKSGSQAIGKIFYRQPIGILETIGSYFKIELENGTYGYIYNTNLSDIQPGGARYTAYVLAAAAKIYSVPSAADAVVAATLSKDTMLEAYETVGTYTRIIYNGQDAYITTTNTTTNAPSIKPPDIKYLTVTVKEVLSQPKSGSQTAGKIFYRQPIEILETIGNYFKIELESETYGYIYNTNLSDTQPGGTQYTAYVLAAAAKVYSVPSAADAAVVATLSKDTMLEAYETVGTYTRIICNGQDAYITTTNTTTNTPAVKPPDIKYLTVTTKEVLSQPKSGSQTVGKIFYRQPIEILETIGNYFKIEFESGTYGYIYNTNLSYTQPDGMQHAAYVLAATAKVYDVPSAADAVVAATLSKDTTLEAYETVGTYTRIIYNGRDAYVTTTSITTNAPSIKPPDIKYLTVATKDVISQPASGSSITGKIYYRHPIEVLETIGNYFKIELENRTYGYIYNTNLNDIQPGGTQHAAYVLAAAAKVYSVPSAADAVVAATLYKDTVLEAYETVGTYTRIIYNGQDAYITTTNITTNAPSIKPPDIKYLTVATKDVISQPASGSSTIGKIYYRQPIEILDTVGNYFKIQLAEGVYGYIYNNNLTDNLPVYPPNNSYVNVTYARLYSMPNSNAGVEISAPYYRTLLTSYETIGSYTRVIWNNQECYVVTANISSTLAPDNGTVKLVNSLTANVRSLPSMADGEVLGSFYYRAQVTCYEEISTYTRIRYGGQDAYVLTSYLSGCMPNPMPAAMYVNVFSTGIYQDPSSDSIQPASVKYGVLLEAYEEIGAYTRIKYNGQFCYVSTSNIIGQLDTTVKKNMQLTSDKVFLRTEPNGDTEPLEMSLRYFDNKDTKTYTEIGFIQQIGPYWAKIEYESEIYYVLLANLRDIQPWPPMVSGTVLELALRDEAISWIGTPYEINSKDYDPFTQVPPDFNCSSFTTFLYKKIAGIDLPDRAWKQSEDESGIEIPLNSLDDIANLRVGDCIYMKVLEDVEYYVDHVVMYIGNGEVIHATSAADGVTVSPIDQFRVDNTINVRRFLVQP